MRAAFYGVSREVTCCSVNPLAAGREARCHVGVLCAIRKIGRTELAAWEGRNIAVREHHQRACGVAELGEAGIGRGLDKPEVVPTASQGKVHEAVSGASQREFINRHPIAFKVRICRVKAHPGAVP